MLHFVSSCGGYIRTIFQVVVGFANRPEVFDCGSPDGMIFDFSKGSAGDGVECLERVLGFKGFKKSMEPSKALDTFDTFSRWTISGDLWRFGTVFVQCAKSIPLSFLLNRQGCRLVRWSFEWIGHDARIAYWELPVRKSKAAVRGAGGLLASAMRSGRGWAYTRLRGESPGLGPGIITGGDSSSASSLKPSWSSGCIT